MYSYHLMVSESLENVGGHLRVLSDILLDLLKPLLLKNKG